MLDHFGLPFALVAGHRLVECAFWREIALADHPRSDLLLSVLTCTDYFGDSLTRLILLEFRVGLGCRVIQTGAVASATTKLAIIDYACPEAYPAMCWTP